MKAYFGSRISPNQTKTPDGFLVAHSVPIARTGWYQYHSSEIGADGDRIVDVYRDPDEVFSPAAMASFEGKPLTNNHPSEGVDPSNSSTYMKGVVTNVRRGKGDEDYLLLADLIAHDEELIKAIENGKREVSAGYECDYQPNDDGTYSQKNIVGNHVAVVDAGRAGDRVRIKDRLYTFADLETADDEGRWATVNGTHIYIENGEVAKGPSNLTKKGNSGHGGKQPSIHDVKKGATIEFHSDVGRNIKSGSKWKVTMEAAPTGQKGNLMLVKLNKKGEPMSGSNPSNVYGLHPNDFEKLMSQNGMTVSGLKSKKEIPPTPSSQSEPGQLSQEQSKKIKDLEKRWKEAEKKSLHWMERRKQETPGVSGRGRMSTIAANWMAHAEERDRLASEIRKIDPSWKEPSLSGNQRSQDADHNNQSQNTKARYSRMSEIKLPTRKPGSVTRLLAAVGLKHFAMDAEPEEVMDAVESMAEERAKDEQAGAGDFPVPTTQEVKSADDEGRDDPIAKLTAQVAALTQLVHQALAPKPEQAPEDALDAEIERLSKEDKGDDDDESQTIEAQDDEGPVSEPEDRPQSAFKAADSAVAYLKAMKPVIAKLKDPAEKKMMVDAALKAVKGTPSKPSATYQKMTTQPVKIAQDTAPKKDVSEIGREIMKKYNPHYKNKEA